MKEQAFKFIDDNRAAMLNLWEELVNMESCSADIEGVNAVAERVKAEIEIIGGTARSIELEKAGNMIVGEIAGGSKPPVMLLGHTDTVFRSGEVKERPFTIKEGVAYGPGVLDMKGGIVIALFAARALAAAGFSERPIKFAFAGDEEVAHINSGTDELFIKEATGCAAAFNCEIGHVDNGVVVGRKGTATFKVVAHGIPAHAGIDPERGRSAILEMSHKIIDIQNLSNLERGYSFNVGVIKGGTVSNAVPGCCEAEVDVRFADQAIVPEIRTMVERTLDKTYIEGTSTELAFFKVGMQPMQTTAGVERLFALWKKVSEENGFGVPEPVKSGGGSDSAYTVMAGVPTICSTGVKGGKSHSKEEFAVVESLFERAKLLAATILRLDEM